MRAVAEGVQLDGVVRVAALLLAAYLMVGQPLVGGWSHRRFRRRLGRDPRARLLRYRRTMLLEWSVLAAALALVGAAPELDLADIGLRWPRLSGGGAPYTVVGTLGLGLSLLLLAGLRRRVDGGAVLQVAGPAAALLPRTFRERRAFAGVAVTAAVCEEALYRGWLLAVLAVPLADPPAAVLILLGASAFGLAHAYQGAVGVLATGVLGGCLTVLYLGSGSLLLPVLYHLLVDLRMLVLAIDHPRHRRQPGPPPRHLGHPGTARQPPD